MERATPRTLTRQQFLRPVYLALLFTVGAELFYFIVWGIVLFPEGNLIAKFGWTMICGIAMGCVISVFTLLFVVGRLSGLNAVLLSALGMAIVGSSCGFLCSRIDATYNYFGGAEHAALFIWGGVIPAVLGGLLYGWVLFSRQGRRLLEKAGI
jgi:hypothetical protein